MALVAGYGVAPSEYWAMTISEIAAYFEVKRGNGAGSYAGGMTEGDLEEISAESDALRRRLKEARGTSPA